MASVLRTFGERLFPERQLLIKSSGGVRHLAVPGWLQAMVLVIFLGSLGSAVYLATGFAHLHQMLGQQNEAARQPAGTAGSQDSASLDQLRAQIAQIQHDLAAANQNFADANAHYQQTRDKLGALTADNDKLRTELGTITQRAKNLQQARDDAERHAKQAEQALNGKSSNLSQLAKTLDDNRSELRQSEAARTTLQNRVQQLQMELQAATSRAASQSAQSGAKDAQQKQVATEPASRSPANQSAGPTAEDTEPDVVAPMPQHNAGSPHARAGSSELERLLASTGLDIDRLIGSLNATASEGQGGPYIALSGPRAAELEKSRQEELKRLAKVLPLRSPLDQYQVRSDFGPRIDPINHRASFHPGLDLAAPYKSAVYSTGPGTVVFTGTREGYGRMVEIDHGHGIVTRYAHLHRILVARGQKVAAHTKVGELGSTGRSTGPHVHYEVDVDGTPLDPAKFMEAGKNVVQISGK